MAVEWRRLKTNPMRALKKLKEPPGRLRHLSLEEIHKLLVCCPPPPHPLRVRLEPSDGDTLPLVPISTPLNDSNLIIETLYKIQREFVVGLHEIGQQKSRKDLDAPQTWKCS
jgi:hypothetical protein